MKTSTHSNVIRLATDADIPALVALENNCFDTDKLNATQLRRFIHSKTALVLVLEKEEGIAAYALSLFRKGSSFTRLYSLAVHPDQRGHGYAAAILNAIEAAAQKRACDQVRLEVRHDNHRAIQLYSQAGYEPFGEYECFYEDGADALRMIKRLK